MSTVNLISEELVERAARALAAEEWNPREAPFEADRTYWMQSARACLAVLLDQELPCEVTVAPATRFAKGVKVGTVLAALDLRRISAAASASNLNEYNSAAQSQMEGAKGPGLLEAAGVLESLVRRYQSLGAHPLAASLTGIAATFRERAEMEAKKS